MESEELEESASSISDGMESGQSFSSDEMDSPPPAKMLKLHRNSEIIDGSNEDNEGISERSFKDNVNAILSKVNEQAAGEFAVSGEITDAPVITISIKTAGSGKLRFPFYEEDAVGIIQSFEQSPYGKGSQTVVDTAVRNSWELEPGGFQILNPKWDVYIKDVLLPRIQKEMVISSPFTASLYKLLLYKTGSFFKPHRDSEKEDGMFATLVIQLPTKYQGGQLVVNHDGKTKTIDFSSSDADTKEFSTFYSAFYCDCQHEILPVTEGLRLCLIYNLISQKNIILLPQRNPFERKLKALFENWGSPGKIVYGLKHKYSVHNISFANLKTTDRTIASMLKYLSEESLPLDIYLATFEKRSKGYGDADEKYGFSSYEDIDFDSDDEYSKKRYDLRNLISLAGDESLPMDKLTVNFKNEVIPEDCFENIVPYHKTQEPSGNEGVECSKAYRSSAIVFWPKKYSLRALRSSGYSKSKVIATFQKGVQEYMENKTEESRKKVLEDAKALVYGESKKDYWDEKKYWNRLLDSIIELKDLDLIQSLCDRILSMNREILPKIFEQCEHFGWKTFEKQLVSMFKKTKDHKEAAELLDSMIGNENMNEERKEIFRSVMSAILEKYKDQPSTCSAYYYVEPPPKTQNEDVEFVFRLAQKIDFNMVELLQSLLQKIVLNESILPWIASECDKYGWKSFIAEIPIMITKSSEFDAADFLEVVIGNDIDDDKKEICSKIMGAILEKIKKENLNRFQRSREQKKDEKLLYSLHASAVKINFNMVELLQTLFETISANASMLPWIVNECKKHDWKSFMGQIPIMVSKLSEFDATDFLELMIEKDIDDDKKEIGRKIVSAVLEKIKKENLGRFQQKREPAKDEKLLYSLCSSAVKINFNMIEVLQTLFSRLNIISQTTFPWVVDQCNTYGWKHFVMQFPLMFEKISNISQAVNCVHLLIGKNAILMNNDKKQVCARVLTGILDKMKGDSLTPDLMYSLCIAANKINHNVIEFMKTRPFTLAVPVLIKLAQSITQEAILAGQWRTIINHFILEMKSLIAKKDEPPNWKIINVPNSCSCKDCSALHNFLKRDLQTQQFKMGKGRRDHLVARMNSIPGVLYNTNFSVPGTGVLIVKKTVKSGQDNFAKGNRAAELLPLLLAVVKK